MFTNYTLVTSTSTTSNVETDMENLITGLLTKIEGNKQVVNYVTNVPIADVSNSGNILQLVLVLSGTSIVSEAQDQEHHYQHFHIERQRFHSITPMKDHSLVLSTSSL
jgi:hypothetical protein